MLLHGLDFSLPEGSLTWLQGGNGTGKTSLLRCLCGLGEAEAGDIFWQGEPVARDPVRFHQELLYLGHKPGLKSELSIAENLGFFRRLRGLPVIDPEPVLEQLGLARYAGQYVGSLSAGQQRKVMLARLLLEPARLWILDEPLVALDHESRDWLAATMMAFREEGGIILYTSHQPLDQVRPDQQIAIQEATP